LELYSWFIPVNFLQGALYGCLRAIGKQNHIIGAQVLANYLIHYSAMAIIFKSTDQINLGICFVFGITYMTMNIYLIIVLLRLDWDVASEEMRKSIGANALDESLEIKLNTETNTVDFEKESRKSIEIEFK